MNFVKKIQLTPEIIKDEKLFWEMFETYIRQEIEIAFSTFIETENKIMEYEIIYGEGSYNELLYGGSVGL